jgi:hypothetical protein
MLMLDRLSMRSAAMFYEKLKLAAIRAPLEAGI